jgi:nickel transport protein
MRMPLRFAATLMAAGLPLGAALLSGPPPASAHAIESSLERVAELNDQLLLESRFGTGEPADAAVVRLIPPGGEPIEIGQTDAEGRLRFSLPSQATSDWEVQVDRGAGHRDYLELPAVAAEGHARPLNPPARPWSSPLSGGLGLALIGLCSLGVILQRRR